MNILDNILELIKINSMEQKEFARKIGVNESIISEWKTGKTKSYSKYLDVISQCFVVPIRYITEERTEPDYYEISYNDNVKCGICGLSFCPNDKSDVEYHKDTHSQYLQAIELFGFCWLQEKREGIKQYSRNIISNNESSKEEKQMAILNIVRSYFSRSVENYTFTINTHPNFDEYFAMILGANSLEDIRKDIPDDIYNGLLTKYGTKKGLKKSNTVYEAIPKSRINKSIKLKENVNNEQIQEFSRIYAKLSPKKKHELMTLVYKYDK